MEGAGLAVSREGGDGVAPSRGRVDVAAVAADGDRVGADEPEGRCAAALRARPRDASGRPGWLREGARPLVAVEDRDRAAGGRGDVDVVAVRADRDRTRSHEGAGALHGPRGGAAGPA